MLQIKRLALIIGLVSGLHVAYADNIQRLKNMFTDMVVHKNIAVVPKYYAKNFKLYSNGKTMGYQQYYDDHKAVYQTPIQYQISYDAATLVEDKQRVAGRIFITTKRPHEKAVKIEVMLVASYNKQHKIERIWELTYPNWTQLKAFKGFAKQ